MDPNILPEFDTTRYRFPQKNDSLGDQWGDTYSLIKGAETEGIVDSPIKPLTKNLRPGESADAIETIPEVTALNPVRFKVIAEQLWLLGYLENKPSAKQAGKIQATRKFKAGVKRFQQEAGLIADGWTGNQTWKAIRTLVNFETETNIGLWKRKDGIFCRAFRRAVQLRLWTYGLARKKPGPNFNAIPKGNLERLKKVLWSLSLIDQYNQEIHREYLFKLLFDPDRLVEAAGRFKPIKKPRFGGSDTFDDNIHDMDKHKGILEIKRRFLTNLAKIELWLLGSDIQIDGKDDYPVEGLGVKKIGGFFSGPATDKQVHKYLLQYWRELSLFGEKEARNISRSITPSLFKSFLKPDETNKNEMLDFKEHDYSKKIVEDFEKQGKKKTLDLIDRSYSVGKGLGMKLWDGLKRLWAWIKRGIKKIISFGKNIFRAFYRFAMKGFKIVKTAFSAFARSMDQYLSGSIDIDNSNKVMIAFKKDMDHQVLICDAAKPEDLRNAKGAVERFGAMFFFSCKIISFFISILKGALGGILSWAKLLMALVKGFRELIPAYRQLAIVL
jgi:hypothetical protein